MKKINTIIIIALLTILQNCDTESNQNKAISNEKADSISILKLTDSLYTSFKNDLNKYHKDSIDTEERSSEGGIVYGYFEGNKLRLIEILYYGDLGRGADEYFFHNDELIFIIEIEEHYNMPFYMEGSEVVKVLKRQYYIRGENILKWIDEQGNVVADSCYAEQMQLLNKQIVKYSEKLKVKQK